MTFISYCNTSSIYGYMREMTFISYYNTPSIYDYMTFISYCNTSSIYGYMKSNDISFLTTTLYPQATVNEIALDDAGDLSVIRRDLQVPNWPKY